MSGWHDTLASLGGLDWILIALLLYSTIRAFVIGLLLEIFSLVGMASGVVLASWNYAGLAMRLVEWLQPVAAISLPVANIAAFLLIILAAVVAAGLAGRILRKSVRSIGLGLVDRVCGAAFGLGRGCLLGVAVTLALTAFDPSSRLIADSQLFPYFLAGAHGVSFVVPKSLERQLSDGTEHIKHTQPVWINRHE